jgi:dipeptidyl aminopeptidase/acylaminoacyl peptidase
MTIRTVLALLFCTTLFSQTEELTEQLSRTVLYTDVAISADGKQVAWIQLTQREGVGRLQIAPAQGGPAAAIAIQPSTGRNDSAPSFSPDSKNLAFFSTAGSKDQPQLWTVLLGGGSARKRTALKGYAGKPRWSHDGRSIAFLYIERGPGGGPLFAAPTKTGVIDEAIQNQRIAVLDVGSGRLQMASPADLHVYDFDWSPDDKSFVATTAPGPGDNNWWIAQIYVFDLASSAARVLYKPPLQVAVPRWSPDGRNIGFIEGLMSDEGFHGGDIFTIPAEGGKPTDRTSGRKTSPSSLYWTNNERIVFTESVGGGSAVSELLLSNGSIRTLWEGGEDMHSFGNFPNLALSADGTVAAAVRSTYTRPMEVWAGPVGRWTAITSANAAQKPAWGEGISLEWANEGYKIQGWLLPPLQVETGKRYPLIIIVHGGPSLIARPAWPSTHMYSIALPALLAARGYFVLMPNPRGSYGQGEAFTQANVKDFGGGDLRDILAGIGAAATSYPIDKGRLGITGWSYGGYMTMWAVTQTDRFRAAVAGAGIADWQSYYGQNLIDRWMVPFFGAPVYDDPAVYAKSSPIQFIKNVRTPTLIVVGERDAEAPPPQSFEFWHALRTLGVATQLVVYPGEGHIFMNPKNLVDMEDRVIGWFDKYLRTGS